MIEQALNHPSCFVFGELLQLPSVLNLSTQPEAKAHHLTLQLLAYGTHADWKSNQQSFIDINKKPMMARKLQLLSLVRVCKDHQTVSYDQIAQVCGLSSSSEQVVEELVMEAYTNQLL